MSLKKNIDNIKQNDFFFNLTKHFEKNKTFYTSLILVGCIIFIWKKFGTSILDQCFKSKVLVTDTSSEIIDKHSEILDGISEINKILSKMDTN